MEKALQPKTDFENLKEEVLARHSGFFAELKALRVHTLAEHPDVAAERFSIYMETAIMLADKVAEITDNTEAYWVLEKAFDEIGPQDSTRLFCKVVLLLKENMCEEDSPLPELMSGVRHRVHAGLRRRNDRK